MKIKETVERDCCMTRDLKNLPHAFQVRYMFCIHCGRHWTDERFCDAAGSMDTRLVPCPWPWEKQ